jgi:hypothetical protein
MGAGIPADGTRSDDSYLPAHAFLLAFLRLARRPVSSQRLNHFAPGSRRYSLTRPSISGLEHRSN